MICKYINSQNEKMDSLVAQSGLLGDQRSQPRKQSGQIGGKKGQLWAQIGQFRVGAILSLGSSQSEPRVDPFGLVES